MLGAVPNVSSAALIAALLAPSPAVAAPVQSVDAIRSVAHHFLAARFEADGTNVQVEVSPPDRRLRLRACSQSLEAFLPHGGQRRGHVTVGVRCPDARPWKLFVQARVRVYREVLVAARPLTRGEVLEERHLERRRHDLNALRPGYFERPEAAIGKRLKRHLDRGTVLTQRMLEVPKSVRRGEKVVLMAESAGLRVRMSGQALSDGALGDAIRVRNLRSRRVVEGVVSARGVVRVGM